MAAPSAPTQASLIREALNESNSIEKYARARDEWFPQILRDVASRRDWKALEATAVILLTENKVTASLPSDYSRWIRFVLYYGHDGLMQTGSVSSFTLAADEDVTEADAEGRYIITTSGTGASQYRVISSYNDSTKVGSPDSNFTTGVAASTGYVIGTTQRELGLAFWEDRELNNKPGIPDSWSEFNKEIVFNCPPDDTGMAGLLDYYIDIDLLDLSSAEMTDIYYRWRLILHWGLCYRAWLERGDGRAVKAEADYERAILTAAKLDERQRRGRRTMKFTSGGGLPVHGI